MGRKSKTGKLGQHGPYWLTMPPKSPYWHITWYEKATRQTKHESLGTTDFKEADRAVALYYLKTIQEEEPLGQDEFTLYDALDYYWDQHAKNLPSEESASISIQYWKDGFPKDATMTELSQPARLTQFVNYLRKQPQRRDKSKKLTEGYISRILSVGRSALKRAQADRKVALVPRVPDNESKRQKRNKQPKGRPLKIEEFARLFLCAEADHLKKFMTIMGNTLCRPDAAFDLGPDQIDWDAGVVDLNPEGREQTNKFRPKIPLTKSLRPHLKAKNVKTFVNYRDNPIAEIDTAWKVMVAKADIAKPERVHPYSIRHTMGRVLEAAGISLEERGLFLGHLPEGAGEMTTIYSPYSPGYLKKAAKAVDAYWTRLQAEIARQAKTFKPRKNRPGQRNDLKQAA